MATKLSTKLLVLLVVFTAVFGKVAARSNPEYVFANEYKTSWQQHIINKIIDICIDSRYVSIKAISKTKPELNELKIRLGVTSDFMTNDQSGAYYKLLCKLADKYSDEVIDSLKSCDITAIDTNEISSMSCASSQDIQVIDKLKKAYCKTKYEAEDFIYLIGEMATSKDMTPNFKFIDLYYRDENNMPTIKYDIDKNKVLIYSYWCKTGQVQWHPIDYGMEQIIWQAIQFNPFNDTELVKASIEQFAKEHFAE